ncbi:4-hydroxyproline epimerase [Parahaliea mediterranea]|uniref:4-hydroxyproline epimerase n=1 Tax=Parahaliea mediterranea TaxID=651086 RepID=UPI000E2F8D4B|nr:4-hydroxyproline epimerase [Parahaliea mediterranea]
MNTAASIRVIDSHTGGEPTRLVIAGGPDLGGGSMAERLAILRREHDWLRRALVNEPRGSDVMVGALLCAPVDPANTAGVIFFNNVGYLGMCGHGTIGLMASLAWLGQIEPGEHHIETPVGVVKATLHDAHTVSVNNVESYRYREAVPVTLPDGSTVSGDIAWGGNWFFLVADHGQAIEPCNTVALTAYAGALRIALGEAGITGADGAEIDHIELFGPPTSAREADSRSFVLCPGNAYDRSPCGTGTSAKLACLQAAGKLQAGQVWRQQSVIGSVFEGSFEPAENGRIRPTITGTAYVNGDFRLVMEAGDPFRHGLPTA